MAKKLSKLKYPALRPEKVALYKKISEEMDRGIGVEGPFTLEELIAHMDKVRARAKKKKSKRK